MRKKVYIMGSAILIFSLLLFESYFIGPQSRDLKESIALKYETLQKYERFIREAETTEEAIKKAIEQTDEIKKQIITENSRFLASAVLQRKVEGLAEKAGLKIISIRPLNVVKYETYMGIPIYFDGSGDIKKISEFLRLIESDKMLIKIDKISMHPLNVSNPKDLRVRIQISGLSKT